MTAVSDLKLIIETAVGHNVNNALLMRIANAYAETDPHSLANFADPENPTNEEKAQLYIDTLKVNGKAVAGNASDRKHDNSARAQRAAARAAAEADLD